MGKGTWKSKTEAPLPDLKTSAPSLADWANAVVDATGTASSGVKEVLAAPDVQTAVKQTITHPVFLAVVVGATLLTPTSWRR
jgi:hypothetical protein